MQLGLSQNNEVALVDEVYENLWILCIHGGYQVEHGSADSMFCVFSCLRKIA